MPRRRAKAVIRTELPILASRAESFEDQVLGALTFIAGADAGAAARLTRIARDFHDCRQMAAQKVARPDCRKSLEAIAERSQQTGEVVALLPGEHRELLGSVARREMPAESRSVLPSELGSVLSEVADLDLRRWTPGTPPQLEPALERFGRLAGDLANRCSNLPTDAEWSLIASQERAEFPFHHSSDDSFLQDLCAALASLSAQAAQWMKSVRGPRSDTAQMLAVEGLKAEFERTGQKATHCTEDTAAYTGRARSLFGQFVHCFFKDVNPADTQRRGLNDAIAFACWESRSAGRKRKMQPKRVA